MQKARDKLKADKTLFNKTMSQIELKPLEGPQVSKIVSEFIKVSKSFSAQDQEKPILSQFNLRIMRGDRIGILGKNGSGKSTFIKLLINELTPDSGKVKLAKTVEFSYLDQKRQDLDPRKTLWQTLCPDGGDYINVGGKDRHVCGYLKDFLFDPKHARDLVGTLSGGQKNRLMLAKILSKPGNLLILDEPTNDLDMDTLDMLTDILTKYKGTLLIVSHDRDFLDQTVTQILAFEGGAKVDGCIGGYTDYLEASGKKPRAILTKTKKPKTIIPPQTKEQTNKKLSYKLQYELENLPSKIETLEKEVTHLEGELSNPNYYMESPTTFDQSVTRLPQAQKELEQAESRWLELEELKQN